MPVSIVVGGQFGSEGKGKVALEIVRRSKRAVVAVRVGGPNSGHTAYDQSGTKHALRQLPAACVDKNVDVVLPSGAYIDVDVLLAELETVGLSESRLLVSENARVILPEHRTWEKAAGLVSAIGSTGAGVGAAVMASVAREATNFELPCALAKDDSRLSRFISDVPRYLRRALEEEERVVVEGTQGFGLSLCDGGFWPKSTSRSTTAAGALSESGLSPLDVDDVVLVVRSYPIRVAGNSGPLVGETTWDDIARKTGRVDNLYEYTTATKRLRRVGHFDADIVRRALVVNRPTRLVMNHLDYVGPEQDLASPCREVARFVEQAERSIGRQIDWFGFSPYGVKERETCFI